LGLATVLEIAKGAGGEVIIESEEGKGTIVSVYLPEGGDG
jgi:signal transduction histidine kinase